MRVELFSRVCDENKRKKTAAICCLLLVFNRQKISSLDDFCALFVFPCSFLYPFKVMWMDASSASPKNQQNSF